MSLETQITTLVTAIGTDIKALRAADGTLASLTTTDKSSLVAALNELKTLIGAGGGATINDASTSSTTQTWSAQKSTAAIAAAVSALVNGAGTTLDTLNELATALGNDPNYATTIATALGKRIRFDAAQTLTAPEQAQACANIGVGDPAHNFVTDYTAAKA